MVGYGDDYKSFLGENGFGSWNQENLDGELNYSEHHAYPSQGKYLRGSCKKFQKWIYG